MPLKGRRAKKKAATQSPPPPTIRIKILSRPSSSGKDSSNSAPDLSEFEAPPNAAKEELECPDTIPVDNEITANARKLSWSKPGATHLAEESDKSAYHGRGMKGVNINGTRSTLAKRPELNSAGSNITPTTYPLPQSKPVAIEPTSKSEVSTLPAEGVQTTQANPTLPSEARTAELLPAEENKSAHAPSLSPPQPDFLADNHPKPVMASSPTLRPVAQDNQSNNPASRSQDGETTKLDPTLSIPLGSQKPYSANEVVATSSASPAQAKPNLVDHNGKSNASAVAGTDKEAATYGAVNNLAVKSTPKAKRTESYPRPSSRPNPMTPLKKNVTPSQAYAGPTFLASPAASSLPIPKLLSKSVPDKRGSSSLKAAMESRARKSPPDTSEESPTLRKSTLNSDFKVDASSAQDIFLQENQVNRPPANRQDNKRTATENSDAPSSPFFLTRPGSSSLPPEHHGSYHTRNITEGSIGGLFPMDIDDQKSASPKPRQQPHWTPQPLPITHPETISSGIPDRPEMSNEERKARSLALKKLLLSPALQPRESSAATNSETREGLRQEFSSPPAFDMAPDARKRPPYRGFPALPGQVEPEVTNTLQYQESPSTSGQMERPHYRGFSSATGQMESKQERLTDKNPLLRNLPGPSRTPTSPGVRPTNQHRMPQLIPHTVGKPVMQNLIPNGPARSHSSPSNLAQQATIAKAYNRTNLSKPPTGPNSLYRDNSCSSPAPWNQSFSQYRDISPFAPSVLAAHSSYFCFDKKPFRDPEVTRSMGEYLQRVIS